MGLTPLLNEVGREVAEYIEREFEDPALTESVRISIHPFKNSFFQLAISYIDLSHCVVLTFAGVEQREELPVERTGGYHWIWSDGPGRNTYRSCYLQFVECGRCI